MIEAVRPMNRLAVKLIATPLLLLGPMPGPATEAPWYHEGWAHRIPLYLSSATPDEIRQQPTLLLGDVELRALGGEARPDLADLRFVHFDAETGEQAPLEHRVEVLPGGDAARLILRTEKSIGRGTGVSDSLWRYGIHMRNNPPVLFRDGRLYITYVARPTDRNVVELLVYDTETRAFEGPVRISELLRNPREEANEHRAGSLLVDHEGYIHITYGAHGGDMHLFYRRSLAPHDISAFTEEVPLTLEVNTYPNIFQLANGEIHVYSRATVGATETSPRTWDVSLYRSLDSGRTWQPRRDIVRSEGWVAYKGAITPDRNGESIHIVWSWYAREGEVDFGHRDVMYARSDDGGRTWSRADGTSHGEAISRTTSNIDYIASGENLRAFDVDVDSQGRPHMIWYDMGEGNRFHHSFWDESRWVTRQLPTDGPVWWGNIRVYEDDSLNIMFRESATSIHSLRSHDHGANWEKSYTSSLGQQRFTIPSMPRPGGGGPFAAVWGANDSQDGYGPLFVLPRSPDHAQTTVYMYYGNAEAQTSSAGSETELMEIAEEFQPGDPEGSLSGRGALSRMLPTPLGHGSFQARLQIPEFDGGHAVAAGFENSDGEVIQLLVADHTGAWGYLDGEGGAKAFPGSPEFAAGTWHDIDIHVDTAAGLFRISVDGSSISGDDGLPLPAATRSPITRYYMEAPQGEEERMNIARIRAYGSPFMLDYSLDMGFPEGGQ